MWDVDFRTAVAQAEMEDRPVPAAFHAFASPSTDGPRLIATTRPEMLAACVAVMVHPEDERYRGLVGAQAITPLFGARVPILADAAASLPRRARASSWSAPSATRPT